jgi:HEAT repeat protein
LLLLPVFISGLLGVLAAGSIRAAEDNADVEFLHRSHIGSDGPALLEFFRNRTLTDLDREKLEQLVRQLGNDLFEAREAASRALVGRGEPALPFLRAALKDSDREVVRRAENCIETIEQGPGPALPAAAARVLAQRRPPGATTALLQYVPYADDETVEDEVLAALVALNAPGKVDDLLVAALQDPLSARRGAAAHVLGRNGTAEQRAIIRKLLADREPRVRFRAAEALLAARDKEGVPVLVDLLGDDPTELTWRVEELLLNLAGEKAPTISAGDGSPAARKAYREAWAGWWRDNGPRIDLARVSDQPAYLNLTLVAEMHANRIWECGPDGKVRWQLGDLACPRDAEALPGRRVLVAECNANRVTERDLQGKVLWEHSVPDPHSCQRLANGNTYIATGRRVVEVTRDHKEVFAYEPEQTFFIHSSQRQPNGYVVLLSMSGILREVNAAGKEVRSFQLDGNNRNWCGVTAVRGGHYLVVDFNQGQVLEVDATGKTTWQVAVQGTSYAQRLPTGNTLLTNFGQHKVLEVDRAGKTVWEKNVDTSPWRVHRR